MPLSRVMGIQMFMTFSPSWLRVRCGLDSDIPAVHPPPHAAAWGDFRFHRRRLPLRAAHVSRSTAPWTLATGGTQPFHADGSAFDLEGLAVGQSLGNLAVGGRQDTAEGRARNAPPLSSLFLVQPFQIGQPDRFELIKREDDLDQLAGRNSCRMGHGRERSPGYPAATSWSGHGSTSQV